MKREKGFVIIIIIQIIVYKIMNLMKNKKKELKMFKINLKKKRA